MLGRWIQVGNHHGDAGGGVGLVIMVVLHKRLVSFRYVTATKKTRCCAQEGTCSGLPTACGAPGPSWQSALGVPNFWTVPNCASQALPQEVSQVSLFGQAPVPICTYLYPSVRFRCVFGRQDYWKEPSPMFTQGLLSQAGHVWVSPPGLM